MDVEWGLIERTARPRRLDLGVEDHNAVASVFNIDAIKLTLDWV